MPRRLSARHPHRQRGAASLLVALVLLLCAGLATLFLSRHVLFEFMASGNHFHASQAFVHAQSGLDWSTAQLNLSTMPPPDPSDTSGTDRQGFERPFTVDLSAVKGDNNAWRVRATGCSGTAGCAHQQMDGVLGQQAVATVEHTVLRLPLLRRLPSAALTAGQWVQACDGLRVTSARQAGLHTWRVQTGGALDWPGQSSQVGGLPTWAPPCKATIPAAADTPGLQAHHADLARWKHDTQPLFEHLHGKALPSVRDDPALTRITGADPQARAQALLAALAQGKRALWVEGDLSLSAPLDTVRPIKSAAEPLLLLVDGDLSIQGPWQATGLLVARAHTWTAGATAPISMRGAVVALTHFQSTGPVSVDFNQPAIERAVFQGPWVPLPGSWRQVESP